LTRRGLRAGETSVDTFSLDTGDVRARLNAGAVP
jgi:hypothetical protein